MAPLVNPAARTTRVWQWNDDTRTAFVLHDVLATDRVAQWLDADKPLDRQLPDGNDQPGPNDAELAREPMAASRALRRRRDTVPSTGGVRARIAACHGRYIEEAASGIFVETSAREPLEQCGSRAAGKGSATAALGLSGRLPNEHRPGSAREGDNREDIGRVRTPPACRELFPMRVECVRELAWSEGPGHAPYYTDVADACRSAEKSYAGRNTPRSVMIAEMSAAGVTSNAGL